MNMLLEIAPVPLIAWPMPVSICALYVMADPPMFAPGNYQMIWPHAVCVSRSGEQLALYARRLAYLVSSRRGKLQRNGVCRTEANSRFT